MLKTHNPLFLPLACMIGGILLAEKCDLGILRGLIVLGVLVLIFLTNKKRIVKSLVIPLLFFWIGVLSIIVNLYSSNRSHFANRDSDFTQVKIDTKESTTKGFRYFATVEATFRDSVRLRCSGKVMIYSDSTVQLTQYNSYLIPSKHRPISIFRNPGHFDYGAYLAIQNIYHSTYLKESPSLIKEANSLLAAVRDLREAAILFFKTEFSDPKKAGIMNAILLGDKKGMEKGTRTVFINNGLAHLLAISGMHVGIILLILNFMFARISLRQLKSVLIISGIWLYILLSGLQIPAIRAGFMFTIYLIGQLSNRNIKSLNSVFFAGMILLALEPKMIYQLSFQLSFTAMISILIFYKKIFELFLFKNILLVKIWQLVALNFSVQILVLPLSIYYFEQLPVYSIISSIISIPFIITIMWGGTLTLLLSYFALVSHIICVSLDYVIGIYLALLHWLASLPFALIQNLRIHDLQLLLWILGSLGFYYFYTGRRSQKTVAYASFIPLILCSSVLNITDSSNNHILIYDDPQQVIIDQVSKKHTIRYKQEMDLYSYQVERNSEKAITLKDLPDELILFNKRIHIIKKKSHPSAVMDICLVSTKQFLPLLEKQCKKIIVPRSITLDHNYINQHKMLTDGAFVLNF